ncbi:MAG: serine/threonine-protein kinase [Jatrophihabitantaceae bacterium]
MLGARYELGEILGAGGWATVFRAQDRVLGRAVAVKVFRTDLAEANERDRSQAEMRLLAGLSHPGLVTVFDAGTDVGEYGRSSSYLVMELIDGPTLAAIIKRGPIRPVDVARVGAQLANALAYTHAKGVIHRDIKPANILLLDPARSHSEHVVAKLSDFGIARMVDGTRMTMDGTTVGTANYLSPEQATGGDLDQSTDVYSLGLVLLECLTGQVAYPGSGVHAAAARLHQPLPIPNTVDADWAGVLTAMTAQEPGRRPTAKQAAADLARLSKANLASAESDTVLLDAVSTDRLGPLPGLRWAPEPGRTRHLRVERAGRTHAVRWALLVLAIAVLLTVAVIFAVTRSGGRSGPPHYPSVPGQLGVDLHRLQQSVQ